MTGHSHEPKNTFVYETHMHTCQASACGKSMGRDYIERYIDAGYAGIMVTDHFYRGNCVIDRRLPWREFVNRFCAGYEDALNEGERKGLPVFFGWEENFDGDEYLIYGLDKTWMLAHPEMAAWTRKQQYEAVRAAGGCVVQAHNLPGQELQPHDLPGPVPVRRGRGLQRRKRAGVEQPRLAVRAGDRQADDRGL